MTRNVSLQHKGEDRHYDAEDEVAHNKTRDCVERLAKEITETERLVETGKKEKRKKEKSKTETETGKNDKNG